VYTLFYNLKEKNHDRPFPSSFRAGVEKIVVASLPTLSHITKEHGVLVSSIAEQYAHEAALLCRMHYIAASLGAVCRERADYN